VVADGEAVTLLQAARLALGWTQGRLLHEMVTVANALGEPIQESASLKVSISKWENGNRQVGRRYRRLFRAVYRMTDAELGFAAGAARPGASVVFAESIPAGVDAAAALWEADDARPSTSPFDGRAYATPALRWLLGSPERPGHPQGRPIGTPHIAAVRQMTAAMRAIDNEFGGGYARASVVRYLHHEVTPLLRDGRYDARLGADLFSAAAEMTQLAGWMTYDSGYHGLAQEYLVHALRLAMAAGDRSLGAEILAAMSHQSTYLRQPAQGVDLARAAAHTATRAGVSALVAEAYLLEAHAHATAGSARACTVMLGRAEHTLDRADRSADPAFLGYFGPAYLSAKFGHCFHELGRPRQAERFARASLDMDESYVRGKAFNLALLAAAHAGQGDVEQACTVGADVLDLAVELRSARAVGYINGLRRQLRPYGSAPAVAEFERRAVAAQT
jgi:transcriptional regulator with XRE-family HTH domain